MKKATFYFKSGNVIEITAEDFIPHIETQSKAVKIVNPIGMDRWIIDFNEVEFTKIENLEK